MEPELQSYVDSLSGSLNDSWKEPKIKDTWSEPKPESRLNKIARVGKWTEPKMQ